MGQGAAWPVAPGRQMSPGKGGPGSLGPAKGTGRPREGCWASRATWCPPASTPAPQLEAETWEMAWLRALGAKVWPACNPGLDFLVAAQPHADGPVLSSKPPHQPRTLPSTPAGPQSDQPTSSRLFRKNAGGWTQSHWSPENQTSQAETGPRGGQVISPPPSLGQMRRLVPRNRVDSTGLRPRAQSWGPRVSSAVPRDCTLQEPAPLPTCWGGGSSTPMTQRWPTA